MGRRKTFKVYNANKKKPKHWKKRRVLPATDSEPVSERVEPNVDSSNQLLYEEETYNVVACKLENEVQIFDESGPSGDAMGVIPADNCIPHSSTSNKRKYEVTEDGLFMPAARCRLESASAGVDTAETEFDVFGRSVAAQLNSIPFKQALELELKIQQLITENRLKWYSESNP